MKVDSYESIKTWKEERIVKYAADSFTLNAFHDSVMHRVFQLAVLRLNKGNPPCDYCWFITGSGGRYEQGTISDQDHGLVFEKGTKENEAYFLELGREVSYGLEVVGYPYCKGDIMSSNPLWCQPIDSWTEQILHWMEERSLEAIRNLQIFYDARCLQGSEPYIKQMKRLIHQYQEEHPVLLQRFVQSVRYVKVVIGPLGQMIPEEKGIHQGCIDLKYAAFLPYVNVIRILAMKEGLLETATLQRIEALEQLNPYTSILSDCRAHFQQLLAHRLSLAKASTYEETHYLPLKSLSKQKRKELKLILKGGKKLHQWIHRLIEKD